MLMVYFADKEECHLDVYEPDIDASSMANRWLSDEEWRVYSRSIANASQQANNTLAGLHIREVYNDGFKIILPSGSDLDAVMAAVAECHPRVIHP